MATPRAAFPHTWVPPALDPSAGSTLATHTGHLLSPQCCHPMWGSDSDRSNLPLPEQGSAFSKPWVSLLCSLQCQRLPKSVLPAKPIYPLFPESSPRLSPGIFGVACL